MKFKKFMTKVKDIIKVILKEDIKSKESERVSILKY